MQTPESFLPSQVLRGRFVSLEPYAADLREPVRDALNRDAGVWDMFTACGAGEHFDGWWEMATAAGWLSFAVRRLRDGRVVGSTSFINIRPERQTVEIGATFYEPPARGGPVNPECKLLLLEHAFAHGVRRVELLADARNARSRAAIAKLGAVEEGTLRRDRITWTGAVRDSVIFSVTDIDWPVVKAGLETRLDSFTRDEPTTTMS